MTVTGEDLKKRREELGLSLTEVSLVTKISLRVLHAIEAMDRTQLPAEIFLKGLLKSYALHLKLDADAVMKGYLAQLNPPPPKPITPAVEEGNETSVTVVAAPAPKPEPVKEAAEHSIPHPTSFQPAKVLWISLTIVGLIIVAVLFKVMSRYQNEAAVVAEQKTDEKSGSILPIAPSNQSAPADSAGVVAADILAPAPMPVPVNPVNNTTETVPVEPQAQPADVAQAPPQTPPPQQPVAEKPPVAPSTQVAVTPPQPKPEEKPKEPEKKPAAATGSKQVILEALDKVNIVIKKGSKQYKVTLQPDEIHTVNYSETIEVEVSDGGAINVIQNGHDNGVAGDLGKPKKISL